MTPLNRPIRRELSITFELDRHSRGRPIVVELQPPGVIVFRWKGTRRRYEIGAAKLMQWTIEESIEQRRREKKAARRQKGNR